MEIGKKYNYVYQITNILNGKIYIGRHSTNNMNDNYMGSGTELMRDMKECGRENFIKDILFVFDNWKDMVDKETELLSEEFVNRDDTYNSTRQGCGLITHTESVRKKLSELNKGMVSVIDKDGKCYRVKIDDPRYLSGELKHNLSGMTTVKDKDGNVLRVPIGDDRIKSGELVGINTGVKQSEERIKNRVEKSKEWWKKNTHTEAGLQRTRDVNKGKVTVRDKDGKLTRVPVDDERIKTGELVYMWVGKTASRSKCEKNSQNKKGCIWITNSELRKNKMIKPDKAIEFLSDGWVRGRIFYKNEEMIFG